MIHALRLNRQELLFDLFSGYSRAGDLDLDFHWIFLRVAAFWCCQGVRRWERGTERQVSGDGILQ